MTQEVQGEQESRRVFARGGDKDVISCTSGFHASRKVENAFLKGGNNLKGSLAADPVHVEIAVGRENLSDPERASGDNKRSVG